MKTRLEIFFYLFKWAFAECWNRFKSGIKAAWKDSWTDSKELHDFHKSKVKKPFFESEDEMYND